MPMPQKNLPAKLSVDFSNVEDGRGRAEHIPEGDYLARVVDCDLRSKKDDPSRKYLNWKLQVVEPTAYKGKTIYFITSLIPESLWNLRNFLVDMLGEEKVPKKALDLPLAKIVAAKPLIGITVQDDEYNNKIQSKVAGTFSKADWAALSASGDDEDESPTGAVTSSDDDEDMDEIDVDDI